MGGMVAEKFEEMIDVVGAIKENQVASKVVSNYSSAMYMGVFNSPVHSGKRRRIDIKIYPYRERVFAYLYFTGNGHFNRSMRLWSKRKFNNWMGILCFND